MRNEPAKLTIFVLICLQFACTPTIRTSSVGVGAEVSADNGNSGQPTNWTIDTNDVSSSLSVNGIVYSIEQTEDIVFVGGNFSKINGVDRTNLAAIDKASGKLLAFNPEPNEIVRRLKINRAKSKLFVGGNYSAIAGESRAGTAAFSISDGEILSFQAEDSHLDIFSMDLSADDSTLYIAGCSTIGFRGYDSVTGEYKELHDVGPGSCQVQQILASPDGQFVYYRSGNDVGRIELSDETKTSYAVSPSDVRSMAMSEDGNFLYIGGAFTMFNAVARTRVASIHLPSNTLTTFAPSVNGEVVNLMVLPDGSELYIQGAFSEAGGQSRAGFAGINTTSFLANAVDISIGGDVQDFKFDSVSSSFYWGGISYFHSEH